MLDNANIVITGGMGAIGSCLARRILKEPIGSLVIIDDFSSSSPAVVMDLLSHPLVTHVRASIVNDEALRHIFLDKRQDIVFHLAAHFAHQSSIEHPIIDCEVNSLGTAKVLEYARRSAVKKFIFASSSCVYGNAKTYDVDTKEFHLDTPYAINKLHGEYLVKFYHEFHGLNTTILRYFNSFGPSELPGRYRNVIPNFFALAMQGKTLPITGDGSISRDFNYVGNTVQATLLAAMQEVSAGKIYNVGSGHEIQIVALANMINLIVGNSAGVEFKPARSWDSIRNRCADVSKTIAELGYAPVIDFQLQLLETYQWLCAHREQFSRVMP